MGNGWLPEACRRAVPCASLDLTGPQGLHGARARAAPLGYESLTLGLGCGAATPETAAPAHSQRPERRTQRIRRRGHGNPERAARWKARAVSGPTSWQPAQRGRDRPGVSRCPQRVSTHPLHPRPGHCPRDPAPGRSLHPPHPGGRHARGRGPTLLPVRNGGDSRHRRRKQRAHAPTARLSRSAPRVRTHTPLGPSVPLSARPAGTAV